MCFKSVLISCNLVVSGFVFGFRLVDLRLTVVERDVTYKMTFSTRGGKCLQICPRSTKKLRPS